MARGILKPRRGTALVKTVGTRSKFRPHPKQIDVVDDQGRPCSCGCGRKVYPVRVKSGRNLSFEQDGERFDLACRAECSERLARQRPDILAILATLLPRTKGAGSAPIAQIFSAPLAPPQLPNVGQFVEVFLAFGADLLERVGVSAHREHYVSKLTPRVRDRFLNRRHCMFSFLADTTTLTFVRHAIEPNMMDGANLLYNLVVGVIVLNSRERFVHMIASRPLDLEAPMTVAEFTAKLEPMFGRRAQPGALLQDVQSILNKYGAREHFANSALFVEDMGRRCPAAWKRLKRARNRLNASDLVLACLKEELGVTSFASLVIARHLSLADPSLFDWGRYDIGDGAKPGLAHVAGAETLTDETARERFELLVRALPAMVREKDLHDIVDTLGEHHMLPLSAQTIEHMLCQFWQVTLSSSRERGGRRTPENVYDALWYVAQRTYRRHAGMRASL